MTNFLTRKEIIAGLRLPTLKTAGEYSEDAANLIEADADRIEALEAEVERLRGLFENAKYEAKAMMEEIERLRAEINSYLEMTGKVTDA